MIRYMVTVTLEHLAEPIDERYPPKFDDGSTPADLDRRVCEKHYLFLKNDSALTLTVDNCGDHIKLRVAEEG